MQRHLRSLQGGFGGKNRSLSGSESDIARHDSMLDASRIRTHTHTHIYIYIYACVFLGSSRWPATAAASVVEFVFILASGAARIRPHPISHWFVFWIRLLDPSFGSFVAAVTRGSGAGPIRPTPITGLDIVPSLYDPVLAVKMSVWCMCVGVLPIVALT